MKKGHQSFARPRGQNFPKGGPGEGEGVVFWGFLLGGGGGRGEDCAQVDAVVVVCSAALVCRRCSW